MHTNSMFVEPAPISLKSISVEISALPPSCTHCTRRLALHKVVAVSIFLLVVLEPLPKKSKSTISQHASSGRWPEIEKILNQYELLVKAIG